MTHHWASFPPGMFCLCGIKARNNNPPFLSIYYMASYSAKDADVS